MKVSIFGLGYVGTVSAGCLAKDGHEVIGVDPVHAKVDLINSGQSPIIEAEIERDHCIDASRSGRLRATGDPAQAIRETELSFVCVGTPSQANGNLDLRYIRRICEQIGEALKNKTARHTVVIRSTILPGTMHKIVIPILEESSGKKAGVDFGVCNNPEFLREGSAVKDFQFAAQDGDRRVGSGQRRHAGDALRETRRALDPDGSRNCRDGQVCRQQLACAQDRFCQ